MNNKFKKYSLNSIRCLIRSDKTTPSISGPYASPQSQPTFDTIETILTKPLALTPTHTRRALTTVLFEHLTGVRSEILFPPNTFSYSFHAILTDRESASFAVDGVEQAILLSVFSGSTKKAVGWGFDSHHRPLCDKPRICRLRSDRIGGSSYRRIWLRSGCMFVERGVCLAHATCKCRRRRKCRFHAILRLSNCASLEIQVQAKCIPTYSQHCGPQSSHSGQTPSQPSQINLSLGEPSTVNNLIERLTARKSSKTHKFPCRTPLSSPRKYSPP